MCKNAYQSSARHWIDTEIMKERLELIKQTGKCFKYKIFIGARIRTTHLINFISDKYAKEFLNFINSAMAKHYFLL